MPPMSNATDGAVSAFEMLQEGAILAGLLHPFTYLVDFWGYTLLGMFIMFAITIRTRNIVMPAVVGIIIGPILLKFAPSAGVRTLGMSLLTFATVAVIMKFIRTLHSR